MPVGLYNFDAPEAYTIENIEIDYSAFNGRTALPVNVRVDTSFLTSDGNEIPFVQTLTPFDQISDPVLRDALERVKTASLRPPRKPIWFPSIRKAFREAGALLFIYEDGTTETRVFTSNQVDVIEGKHIDAALRKMRIFDEIDKGNKPSKIYNIHSHPGPELVPKIKEDICLLMS